MRKYGGLCCCETIIFFEVEKVEDVEDQDEDEEDDGNSSGSTRVEDRSRRGDNDIVHVRKGARRGTGPGIVLDVEKRSRKAQFSSIV
jgi:hypothetical protein